MDNCLSIDIAGRQSDLESSAIYHEPVEMEYDDGPDGDDGVAGGEDGVAGGDENHFSVVWPEENDDWEDVPDDVENDPQHEFDELRHFMKSSKLTCTQGNQLLKFLRRKHPEAQYPSSWRQLFKTPRQSIVPVVMGEGLFHYFGIANGIRNYHSSVYADLTKVCLDVGIDGFSIAKSSSYCGWPILGVLSNEPIPPFLIAMYVG